MAFHLRRIRDGRGDSGSCSESIDVSGNIVGYFPTIECSMKVGSPFARSYSSQDWWMTTPVTEILEEVKNEYTFYIKFKTLNSEYEWWNGQYPK